jgi:hypothetical protein
MMFTQGHEYLTFYNSAENTQKHKLPCKVLCAHCHSPIMDEGRNVVLLFPELIDFGHGLEKGDEKGISERRGWFAPR